MIKLQLANQSQLNNSRAFLFTEEKPDLASGGIASADISLVERLKEAKKTVVSLYQGEKNDFFQFVEPKSNDFISLEAARKAGAYLASEVKSLRLSNIIISTDSTNPEILLAYAEGLALASYQFGKYKKEVPQITLQTIFLDGNINEGQLNELEAIIEGTFITRDLVNTPASHQSAEQLSESIKDIGTKAGFKVEVLNKSKIEALKMGGLLSVAAGSLDPPTFNIMEWKPENAKNSKPVIFVGKGVVFDTGGLTLKPTPNSMDLMKSDMAGAAVIGAIYAIASAKLPYHIIGLIPATDNRPGVRATEPGDVITMYDGTTVEVMNTDAEGRLILGDALHYAKKYNPEMVIDLATLTGAAARAIGQQGIVYMSTATEKDKSILEKSGEEIYERCVEFPLWEEYGELIKSDIADLKNVASGANAAAITAGKFLEHFTEGYPWIHLDIAAPAFISANDAYRPKFATGVGVRLLLKYLKNRY